MQPADLDHLRTWRELVAEIADQQLNDNVVRITDDQLLRAVILADAEIVRDAISDTDVSDVSLAHMRLIAALPRLDGRPQVAPRPVQLVMAALCDAYGDEIRKAVRTQLEKHVRAFWLDRELQRLALPYADYCRQFVSAGHGGEL